MARHKEFDREAVLERAMDLFWARGYEATSIQDLVGAMGINRGSLYDTFGDKRSLFQAAIAHYEATVVHQALAGLEAPNAGRQTIVDHFHHLVDQAATDAQRRGCLVTNSAVELGGHDLETHRQVSNNLQRIEQAFCHALTQAQAQGDLPQQVNIRPLARYLTSSLQGLRVVSKVNADQQFLREIVDNILMVLPN